MMAQNTEELAHAALHTLGSEQGFQAGSLRTMQKTPSKLISAFQN